MTNPAIRKNTLHLLKHFWAKHEEIIDKTVQFGVCQGSFTIIHYPSPLNPINPLESAKGLVAGLVLRGQFHVLGVALETGGRRGTDAALRDGPASIAAELHVFALPAVRLGELHSWAIILAWPTIPNMIH